MTMLTCETCGKAIAGGYFLSAQYGIVCNDCFNRGVLTPPSTWDRVALVLWSLVGVSTAVFTVLIWRMFG